MWKLKIIAKEREGVKIPIYKRNFHTEVKCQWCGKLWLWGLSWNGSREEDFKCPDCLKTEKIENEVVSEAEYNQAMEDFACWETDIHLKSCDKHL